MEILFLPARISCEYQPGETLLQIAARAGIYLDSACGGKGTCNKCQVKVIDENGRIAYQLACQYRPEGNLRVELKNAAAASERKEQLLFLMKSFRCTAAARRYTEGYGLAFDIGTTTVVGILWDYGKNELVDVVADSNPQSYYGADVISRILYASESNENLQTVHTAIIDCMNQMINQLTVKAGISKDAVYYTTVVGNTTMSHLFLGINPFNLARAPFTPEYVGPVEDLVTRVGLRLNPNSHFLLLPNIAGHVGSDITAGILSSKMVAPSKNNILIDIGTNGEIVCAAKGKIYVCSTAAGPAFEGAVIQHGMRAANGAIECVEPTASGFAIRTIGDLPAIGICGSGIIDAVAAFLKKGIINAKGKLTRNLSDPNLLESSREYVLARNGEHNITISQNDIREVQLAKGSMRAGMEVLLSEAGLTWTDVDRFYIAGAFGSFINIESAITLGLLPDISRKRIINIGNAAGVGALMALISTTAARRANKLAGSAKHIELSNLHRFEEEYYKHLLFPKQGSSKRDGETAMSRRQQALQTKESLYNAGIVLFNEKGYENTTIEDITSRAGTATGTFYLYFRSKKELVCHTVDHYNTIARNAYCEVEDLPTFQEQLTTFMELLYRDVNQMGKEILKALYWNNLTEDTQCVNDPNRSIYSCIRQMVQFGRETGELSPERPIDLYIQQIVVTLLGIDYHWCSMPGEVDVLKVSKEQFETLLRGIISNPKQLLN